MSNRIEPKLSTPLPELPKNNILIPLDIISIQYNSFPNMKTPKLQPLNKNTLTFPAMRNVVKPLKVLESLERSTPIKKVNKLIKRCKNMYIYYLLIFIISLVTTTTIYTILIYVNKL